MSDVEPDPKFALRVKVHDPTDFIDLKDFLAQLADVKVEEHLSEIYVVPQSECDLSKLSGAIKGFTEQWLECRANAISVEIHEPNGQVQVLKKSSEASDSHGCSVI